MELGVDRVHGRNGVGAEGGSDLGHGAADLPEVQPGGVDELAGHEGQGSTAVEVTVVLGRQTGVEVVTDGTVHVHEVIPADGGVGEEGTGLVVRLAVAGAVGAVGSSQVVETIHTQATARRTVDIVVIILAGFGESRGLDGEAVLGELAGPGQVSLTGQVAGLALVRTEIRIEVDGAGAILVLVLTGVHDVGDTGAETEVQRQGGINIAGEGVIVGNAETVVVLHHRERVVMEVGGIAVVAGIEIGGGGSAFDVPGTPGAVRAPPILQGGDVHVGVTPLGEVADVVTVGGITLGGSIQVLAQTIAVADVGGEPAGRLELGGDAEGTAGSLGVVEDTGAVHIAEGHAGVHALGGLDEGHVGIVRPGDAGQVAHVQAIAPGVGLAEVLGSRIPGEGGAVEGLVIEARAPGHVLAVVVHIGSVRELHVVVGEAGGSVVDVAAIGGILGGRLGGHGTTAVELLEVQVVVVNFGGSGLSELHDGGAFLGLLGGDDHGTVGAAGTVQGGGGRAFQDVHALHVVHVHGVGVAVDGAIDDIDRLGAFLGTVGGRTTEDDTALVEGGTAGSPELGAGNLTGQGVTHGGAVREGELLVREDLGGVTDRLLLAGQTLGSDDDLVEVLGVRLEGDVHDRHAVDLDRLSLVTHVADDEDAVSRSRERVGTRHVRERVGSGASLHDDGCTGDGLTVGSVGDGSLDGDVLCPQRRRSDSQQARQEQFYFFHKQDLWLNNDIESELIVRKLSIC